MGHNRGAGAVKKGVKSTAISQGQKRKHPPSEIPADGQQTRVQDASKSASKKQKEDPESKASNSSAIIKKLLSTYGTTPVSDCKLSEPDKPTAATVLAHLLHAMLTSARISHQLASRSIKARIEHNYHGVQVLSKSSWEERTVVLTERGYTRYREKTATALGELAEFILQEFDGDLNNLQRAADDNPCVNVLCDSLQALWPSLAPFIDPRSLATAEKLGLSSDINQLYDEVDKDPKEMARLCMALTTVRLGKKEKEFS